MTFDQLGLSADILRAVSDQGYSRPTPIQSRAIPLILEGRDLLAGAQTGTGKTAGFMLPLLERLDTNPRRYKGKGPRALILTPTRELAAQVGESAARYGEHMDLTHAVVFGGVKINPQIQLLRKGVDILVATPGRLLDHVSQKTVDLTGVEILVLDEADRMLDMGFIHDIRKILALLPEQRQNLLFSATFSEEIRELADRLLDNPVSVDVAPRNTAAETVAQKVYRVDRKRKSELLAWLVGHHNWQQVLVFTRTKHGANRLVQYLEKAGISAAAIHGNKSQGARTRALVAFKQGDIRVLVATDIAARGLDIDQLPHVVNFELPNVAEDYVHRIGRTGRAGCEGEAISLVCVDEDRLLRDIERLLGRSLPSEMVEGFEPDPSIQPEPIQQRGRRGDASGRGKPRGRNGQRSSGQRGEKATRGRNKTRASKPKKPDPAISRDENGDINGNTLFADNSNRDPVMLAGGYEIARRKRGNGAKRKAGAQARSGNGKSGKRRGGNGPRRRSSPVSG